MVVGMLQWGDARRSGQRWRQWMQLEAAHGQRAMARRSCQAARHSRERHVGFDEARRDAVDGDAGRRQVGLLRQ